jgi:ADP-ribosylglycohydrolase
MRDPSGRVEPGKGVACPVSSSGSPDRIAGVLVGLAAGDALGAGYEFGPPLAHDPEMKGGGPWEPGEWTDDTSMAICIAEVTAQGEPDPIRIGDRFLDWYRSNPKDVGIQTRAVLATAESGEDLSRLANDYFTRNPKGAAGNGSLMRTAPIALAHLGDDQAIWESAQTISALTHGDPLAGEACALWCIAIDRAISDSRWDGVKDGLDYLPSDSRARWEGWIQEAETKPPSTFARNGFVVPAFQAAYASIIQTDVHKDIPCLHFQAALKTAVRIGDDTDTVAAIAGSLLGARWGASALPFTWRRLIHGWPGYRVRDLVRLAILTAKKGQVEPTEWPLAPSMHDEYARFQPRGLAKPLEDDPGVLVGDVKGLEGEGGQGDVVISLSRVGAEDVPTSAEHHEVWLIDQHGANPNLDFTLSDTAKGIAAARDEGKTVFVHCVRAESRTPTLAAAYLAHRLGIYSEEAIERVRKVLPGSDPKPWFRRALGRLWPNEG